MLIFARSQPGCVAAAPVAAASALRSEIPSQTLHAAQLQKTAPHIMPSRLGDVKAARELDLVWMSQ